MKASLIYEGLHETCPLCEGESHSCPRLPMHKKIEVIVEKFDAQEIGQTSPKTTAFASEPPMVTENWVTVAPKKRIKSFSSIHLSRTLVFKPFGSDPILDQSMSKAGISNDVVLQVNQPPCHCQC